jgi:lipopolysaccharide biosynthesis glycosyltransferase
MVDGKPFSTEFSHTRFLVPHLMQYKGWALFADSDMLFQSDIKNLFSLCNDKYAVMCVKHQHKPQHGSIKMDGREQLSYFRKNWSSFVLWNCGHPANAYVTPERVSMIKGTDLHSFKWLADDLIGELPWGYNYISGVSPRVEPQVIHYTDGGPWFPEMPDVPYGDRWLEEYEEWQQNSKFEFISAVPASMERERRYRPTEEYKLAGGENILEMEIVNQEQDL